MPSSDAVRSKKVAAARIYECQVCHRMSCYPVICSTTCRDRATPAQATPHLANSSLRWNAQP